MAESVFQAVTVHLENFYMLGNVSSRMIVRVSIRKSSIVQDTSSRLTATTGLYAVYLVSSIH